MNDKTKTRPASGAAEAGRAETAAGQAAISMSNYSTGSTDSQRGFIAGLLLYGAEYGQTISDLERLTGRRSREIRKQIEQERRAGALIISDNKSGYFLTDDPAEAQRFAQSMRHRAAQIRQTATAVEKAAGLL